VVPFGILGFSGIAKPKEGEKINLPKVLVTFGMLMFLRFFCHFITGMTIWGQWDDGFWGAFIYSMTYNGGYMLPEAIFTLAITALLFSSSEIGKIIAKTNNK
jgi:thiamine transporter